MLYHLFEEKWFGKYFDRALPFDTVKWVKREHLEAGFRDGIIDQDHVIPFLKDLHPGKGKNLREES